jgi:hypothetical protein
VLKTFGLSYRAKVGYLTALGFLIGLAAHGPMWTWFGFPVRFVLAQVFDFTLAWLLAG